MPFFSMRRPVGETVVPFFEWHESQRDLPAFDFCFQRFAGKKIKGSFIEAPAVPIKELL